MQKDKQSSVEEKKRRRSLWYSVFDGSAYSVMSSFGEAYISPLAIALGASNKQIGFLASFPSLAGSFSQLSGARLTETLKKRKPIILTFVLLQALLWLPIIALLYFVGKFDVFILIAMFTLYAIFRNIVMPAWFSMMGDLVKENERGRYFGTRNFVTGLVAFVSLLTAGAILHHFNHFTSRVFTGFALLFFVAFVARMFSLYFLSRQHEPKYKNPTDRTQLSKFALQIIGTPFGRFVLYCNMLRFATYIASPFFAVYMLRNLHFSYMQFTFVTAATTISGFLAYAYWGKHSDLFGNRKVLFVTGMLIPAVPLLWMLSGNMFYLMFVESVSGFAWAGFNLASSNYLFDAVPSENRTKYVAFFDLTNGISVFFGSILGGYLAQHIKPLIFSSGLLMLFLISGILRLTVSVCFLPHIKEYRKVRRVSAKKFVWNLINISPTRYFSSDIIASLKRIKP